jgi:hypothetical protein
MKGRRRGIRECLVPSKPKINLEGDRNQPFFLHKGGAEISGEGKTNF